ncbi:membrane protein insertase YidC [Desulfurivibrio alkaliphilus]|uniref:Membrane protein insertase YidC n=1 Tax=Desulfurivibrio alkaliphilus (strain DSM 19089 / UNIQEM U267 / AHT2) TaxID=589865 RepID=D6Z0W0_DESAT|nr:membrane protein insertase YidC [Desulfurivibrio alkaliphilus]ADH87220.1 membrane protein insertase, YidC/Oxa1 family [Desulfurivibrio alkaliphilus AHT 2]
MDNYRALIAIVLSMAVLLIYQFLFMPPPAPVTDAPGEAERVAAERSPAAEALSPADLADPALVEEAQRPVDVASLLDPADRAREIRVKTGLYTAVISEAGGVLQSFTLNEFRETVDPGSPPKDLIRVEPDDGLPLLFSWGVEPSRAEMLHYTADRERLVVGQGQERTLTLRAQSPLGLEFIRTYTFRDGDYLIDVAVEVVNRGEVPLQGAPYLTLVNRPFVATGDPLEHFLFTGPAALVDNEVQQVKVKDLAGERAGRSFTGRVRWAGYHDSYFLTSIIPLATDQATAHFSSRRDELVTTVLASAADIIPAGGAHRYDYMVYFGPKKLTLLNELGHDLARAVNFGWFDFLARPTFYLLHFLYGLVGNYGVAIILVTIIIKAAFWPLTQKGLKSMKVMQKIQPKMTKLREKYKDDRQRQQQEMLKLYQTYKVNPLGGCLPMLLQIPVFFALYKVLLQSIELRHAPFMLWINDLSAPDRLYIGFDIPWLGGIPVLTLLMALSMFVQQKMTPISDPMQARIMLFLPVVFFFLFLNFASGLVLYWFINNVLTIAQQYMIYRQKD